MYKFMLAFWKKIWYTKYSTNVQVHKDLYVCMDDGRWNIMKADREKISLIMARTCTGMASLTQKANMPRSTVNKVIAGKSVRPETIGKIAKALQVDISEILGD